MRKKSIVVISLLILMMSAMIMPTFARGLVSTEETNLNVRAESSTSSEIIASLNKGSYVELISHEDGWWYLEYEKGKYGYCSDEYITELNSDINYIRDGYYEAATLDVADYKQYDSQWSKLKIGRSGQTVHYIGCALTCVAMVETYRSDKSVTPKDVVRTFSFTSGGAIYWTKNYSANYSKNYLDIIYHELQQGNPVIIEGKTSGNATHWVVITGFTGGDELSSDKFTINDPGSSKRILLSDFFDVYPIYSKFMQVSLK